MVDILLLKYNKRPVQFRNVAQLGAKLRSGSLLHTSLPSFGGISVKKITELTNGGGGTHAGSVGEEGSGRLATRRRSDIEV